MTVANSTESVYNEMMRTKRPTSFKKTLGTMSGSASNFIISKGGRTKGAKSDRVRVTLREGRLDRTGAIKANAPKIINALVTRNL